MSPPKRGDLATKLRAHWVRQHAGDAEDANAETLPGAYDAVKGQLPPAAGGPDLFIDQCKYAWGRLGLDVELPTRLREKRLAPIRVLGADAAVRGFSGMMIQVGPVQHPDVFAASLPPAYGLTPPSYPEAEDVARAARQDGFTLVCTLKLDSGGGTAYLDSMDFKLVAKSGHEPLSKTIPGDRSGRIIGRQWSYSPD